MRYRVEHFKLKLQNFDCINLTSTSNEKNTAC